MKTKKQTKEAAATEKRFHLIITNNCNNNCVFCLAAEEMRQRPGHRPFAEIEKELAKGLEEGASRLILSGGEASIHPDFLRIIQKAKEMGYAKVQTISNGRMYAYEKFLEKVIEAGLDEITFSLHGDSARLHDAQVGVPGAFYQAVRGLKNAVGSGRLIVNVDIVINKKNYGRIDKIINFFKRFNIYEFDLLQFVPFGNAWKNREEIFYDLDSHSLKHLERAFKISRQPEMFIWTNRLPAPYLEGFEELIQHPIKLKDEITGRLEEFEEWIKSGKRFGCWQERCEWCFIKDFCQDLDLLLSEKKIASLPGPACLPAGQKKEKTFSFREGADIFAFADFYIENRYFVKSLRCRDCVNAGSCRGASINLIKEKGFKILKPIKKNG